MATVMLWCVMALSSGLASPGSLVGEIWEMIFCARLREEG